MNVQETKETRELTPDELDLVSGAAARCKNSVAPQGVCGPELVYRSGPNIIPDIIWWMVGE
jgi:hypothetical protein